MSSSYVHSKIPMLVQEKQAKVVCVISEPMFFLIEFLLYLFFKCLCVENSVSGICVENPVYMWRSENNMLEFILSPMWVIGIKFR